MNRIKMLLLMTGALGFSLYTHAQDNSTLLKDSTDLTPKSEEVVISEDELDDESSDNSQNISGLLNSGKDPFQVAAGYNLNTFRFKLRGYGNEYDNVYINGVLMNENENGKFVYSLMGGLNDVIRNRESTIGMEASWYSFGNLSQSTNIDTRASQYTKGTKIGLGAGNQSYNGRLAATYSTGLLPSGWAFVVSGSRRMTFDGKEYEKGCFYDAWGAALMAEKKFNDRSSLSLSAFYAPVKRGMQSSEVQEAYDLTGTNYYNSNWGYQNGKVRNARVSDNKAPVAVLSHEWKINKDLKWINALAFKYSASSTTALNWYNSSDPRPDYYRYLPSYFTSTSAETADLLTQAWQTDEATQQINWDNLYQINYMANMTGLSARYILEEKHNDQLALNLNSTANWKINKHASLDGGLYASTTKGKHYKKLADLLGANYWLDIDQYAQRDFAGSTTALQNDLNNPDREIQVGDIFGYNYNLFVHKASAWANAKYSLAQVDFNLAGSLTGTEFYREGLMKNGRAPENSYGVGTKHNFLDYGVKGNVTYKLTGRHIFSANAMYQTNAPDAKNAYISPNIKDNAITGLKSEKVLSYDVNYFLRLPLFSARITAYRTDFKDQAQVTSFYSDNLLTYVNQALVGINKTHQGIEIGIGAKVTPVITVYGALSIGQYKYTSRPTAVTSYENGSNPDTTQTVYLKNFNVSGSPQTASTVGLKFSLPHSWYVGANANYGGHSYIDMYYTRRTSSAISYGMTETQITDISSQEELKGGYTFDASVGKSWKVMHRYFFNASLMVNNLLNNTSIQSGGYEQSRENTTTNEFFSSKYSYSYGRTWMLTLGLKF
ncbi:MAG: TonB-dependent receptor [Paludibacteraceae bacterium]|nr:TonB-dependent receptor [Paludibacteraceae bacterium]